MRIMLSIIIPVLNEAKNIQSTLRRLQAILPEESELIVVDGGSDDNTYQLASSLVDKTVRSEKGRAKQMNTGANLAQGQILVFLHSDTHLPEAAYYALLELGRSSSKACYWGFFPVRLSGSALGLRIIERCINLRSRLTSVATGDQCLFISKPLFEKEPYKDMPLMEDVEISKRLRKCSPPKVLPYFAQTSSRRWKKKGIVKTVILVWALRLFYFFGVPAKTLAKYYR